MKHYHLTIISKNKTTLINFFKFFANKKLININFLQKYFKNKTKKKFLTILKSPHINKSAQEQFEMRFFSKKTTIYSPKNFQSLIFLKKIKLNIFPDIKIKIKFFANKKLKIKTQLLNPNNFQLNYYDSFIKQSSYVNSHQFIKKPKNDKPPIRQIDNFLKILDSYGEVNF